MAQYQDQMAFGSGVLIGTSATLSNPTPRRFGVLQDFSIDFSADLKEAYGQSRYPLATAPGKTKIEGKAKFIGIRGDLFNELYFGLTAAATQTLFADMESGTIPASSAYTLTVTNGANFVANGNVFFGATGLPLKRVASAPAASQYSVNTTTGVYTFASADAGKAVYISYTYSSAAGVQLSITNPKMGVGPSFSIIANQTFDGRQLTYTFPQCQSSKLSLPGKNDDFQIAEFDFQVSADATGVIGTINTSL